jgi:DinB family protein
MADINGVLIANRAAVNDLIAAAGRSTSVWSTAPAPGKWSPSQIVEHVARSLEESANVVSGTPSKLLTLPFFLRPLVRRLLFNRVLRTNGFPKARTNKAMNPATGPATPAAARGRLEEALAKFDRECRACATAGRTVTSGAFGTVPLNDYAKFIEIHTRHHCKQMPDYLKGSGA